jgi:phosphatidylethanolamine/phosphatidyl-N-methylethanolamine N-methyltransferase
MIVGNTPGWNRVRYSLYAPIYDWIVRLDRARRHSIELLALQSGERVILPGAGTGQDLALLPPGVHALAGDTAPGMLRQLHRAAARSEASVEVRELDAERLDCPDGSFDAAILHLIVAIVPDPRASLEEAARVVRPGGRVVILDKFAPAGRRVPVWRKVLNPLVEFLASSIDRQVEALLEGLPFRVVKREKVALGGLLEVLLLVREPAGTKGSPDG